jgi:hypothetical protein
MAKNYPGGVAAKCDRCKKEAVILPSTMGRKHKRCSGHKNGMPRKDNGVWKTPSDVQDDPKEEVKSEPTI